MRKNIWLLLFCLVCLSVADAYGEKNTRLDVQLGNGWHALGYDAVADVLNGNGSVEMGSSDKRWGCNVGALVNQYFKYGVGWQAGLRLYLNRTECPLDSTERYLTSDLANGMACVRAVRYDDWNEKQSNLLLAVPVGIAYMKDLNEKWDVYADAGLELLLPLVSHYKVEEGAVSVSGYYSEYDVEFSDLPVHNFTSYEDSPNGDFSLKVGTAAYFDVGTRYRIGKIDLSAGFYFSYGFLNMASGGNGHLFDSENDYAGLLNSKIVKKANPVAFGFKVGVSVPLFGKKTD